MTISTSRARLTARFGPALAIVLAAAASASGQILTTPTLDPGLIGTALRARGLTIDQVLIKQAQPGQVGTYSRFSLGPVTIRDGVVLSSGSVANLAPFPEASDPEYDPASPPAQVNNEMTPGGAPGGTPEFDAYGLTAGNIQNFTASYDVVAVEIHFTLENPSPIKFDFIFGSVEYPAWTSQFTDAFLVFLDGTTPDDQITFDNGGNAVQVGSSFAGLTTTADVNTAFSAPHGLIHHLTTTSRMLEDGEHVIIFEVGDVNDHILDSAAFITNFRAELGSEGTEPSEDACSLADIVSVGGAVPPDGLLTGDDYVAFINAFAEGLLLADIVAIGGDDHPDGLITGDDFVAFIAAFAEGCDS